MNKRPGGAEPLFSEYENAVIEFLRAGGHTPVVIRSPRRLVNQFKAAFGGSLVYAGGARIEEAAQERVSVRGTTIAGHEFEWPEP